jgi:hypothetical protein
MAEMHNLLKYCSYIGLIINVVAIIFTVLPYIGFETFKTISTVIFFIAFGIDLALIALNLSLVNRQDSIGQKLKGFSRIYLVFLFLAAVLLFGSSALYSFFEGATLATVCTLIAYYGMFGLGLVTIFLDLQNRNRIETWK